MITFSTTYRTQETPESLYATCQVLTVVMQTAHGDVEAPCNLHYITTKPGYQEVRKAICEEWASLFYCSRWIAEAAKTLHVKPASILDEWAAWQGYTF